MGRNLQTRRNLNIGLSSLHLSFHFSWAEANHRSQGCSCDVLICLCLALSLAAVNSVTVTFMSALCDCVYSRFIVGIYLTRLNTVVSFTKDGFTSELHIIGCVGGLYKVCVLLRLSY